MSESKKLEYLNSTETRNYLKISSCDLMHYRLKGKLNFMKKGNAFYYKLSDVIIIKKLNA
jgi:hypothetical protein